MNLKEMRQNAGYTQKAITEVIPNVSQGLISQWESGECYPHLTKILRLAEMYGVTAEEILTACEAAKHHKKAKKQKLHVQSGQDAL